MTNKLSSTILQKTRKIKVSAPSGVYRIHTLYMCRIPLQLASLTKSEEVGGGTNNVIFIKMRQPAIILLNAISYIYIYIKLTPESTFFSFKDSALPDLPKTASPKNPKSLVGPK